MGEDNKELFRRILPLRGDSLLPGVDLSTFDFGVNAGTRRSVELLN